MPSVQGRAGACGGDASAIGDTSGRRVSPIGLGAATVADSGTPMESGIRGAVTRSAESPAAFVPEAESRLGVSGESAFVCVTRVSSGRDGISERQGDLHEESANASAVPLESREAAWTKCA